MENKELRRKARELLGNKIFGNTWLVMLLTYFVVGLIIGAAGGTFVGGLILSGPISYGLARFAVNFIRSNGEEANKYEKLLDGFKEKFLDSLVLYLLMYAYILLWSLLLIIPGIIKSYAYSQAFYIMQDNPELDAQEALNLSKKVMKGKKWKLFCLDLSFIGWYLLGMLCLGVGVLWVDPYQKVASALFYEENVKEEVASLKLAKIEEVKE